MARKNETYTEATEAQRTQRNTPRSWGSRARDKNIGFGKSWGGREGSRLPFHSNRSQLEVWFVENG